MHVRLIGVSKIVLRCEFVCGCFSLCDPVMDWQPIENGWILDIYYIDNTIITSIFPLSFE